MTKYWRDVYYNDEVGIIETIGDDGLTTWGYHDEAWVVANYPGAKRMTYEEARALQRAKYVKPPSEITREQWIEHLEVLPPARWVQLDNCETFQCSELWIDDVAAIYARIGNRYFALSDRKSMTHADVIARCAVMP